MEYKKLVKDTIQPANSDKMALFDRYYHLLVEWNEKFNLTAITDEEEVYLKHFYDSIVGEKYIHEGAHIADIGAGAGFPSIPLKIVRDDITVDMFDSLGKRITFLNEVIGALDLDNITATHTRVEDVAKTSRGKYDYIVARAVASLPTLLEYAMPLLKVGGKLIAYKGSNVEEELEASQNALKVLGASIVSVDTFTLADTDITRSFVIVQLDKPVAKKYPRGQNKPKSNPL